MSFIRLAIENRVLKIPIWGEGGAIFSIFGTPVCKICFVYRQSLKIHMVASFCQGKQSSWVFRKPFCRRLIEFYSKTVTKLDF